MIRLRIKNESDRGSIGVSYIPNNRTHKVAESYKLLPCGAMVDVQLVGQDRAKLQATMNGGNMFRARITNDSTNDYELIDVVVTRKPGSEYEPMKATISQGQTFMAKWEEGDTLELVERVDAIDPPTE